MLHIPDHPLLDKKLQYEPLVVAYLRDSDGLGVIPQSLQQEITTKLDAQLDNEQFYYVIDVRKDEILHCNGINKWLGYPELDFTRKKFKSLIHPSFTFLLGIYVKALFAYFQNKATTFQFGYPVCAILLAIKDSSGHYQYCKGKCYPFQLSGQGHITEYIVVANIIKPLSNEDYCFMLFCDNGKRNEFEEIIKQDIQESFKEGEYFSFQEYRILKKYAQDSTTTSEAIAKTFKIEKATIGTYNTRILKKAEALFNQRFDNAKKVAEFLKRVNLI